MVVNNMITEGWACGWVERFLSGWDKWLEGVIHLEMEKH